MQHTVRNNTKINFDLCALTSKNVNQMHKSELPVAHAEQQERMNRSWYYTVVDSLIAAPAAYVMGTVTGNPIVAGVTFGACLLASYINKKDYKDAKIKTEILTNEIGNRQWLTTELARTEIPGRIHGIDPMSALIATGGIEKKGPKPV